MLNGNKSILYTVSLSTTKDNVSPVLDIDSNLITVASRIDKPTGNEDRFGTISQTLTVPTNSNYAVSTITPDTVGTVIMTFNQATGGNFTNTVDTATRLTQTASSASGQIVNVNLSESTLTLIDVIGEFVPGNPIAQSSVTANNVSSYQIRYCYWMGLWNWILESEIDHTQSL